MVEKWPKMTQIAKKWPKIAHNGPKITQNYQNGPKMTQNGPKISTSWKKNTDISAASAAFCISEWYVAFPAYESYYDAMVKI